MKTTVILLFLIVTYVSGAILFHQPVAQLRAEPRSEKRQDPSETLFDEPSSSGVTAPRSFDGPTVSGFNFDSFAADDFVNEDVWSINTIDIKIAVNQLNHYDIDRVYVAIYPDEGRGLPDYHPYDRFNPEPEWYSWYDWHSDNPNIAYPAPWLDNPVRAAAIIVNTTGQIDLKPGHWWLTFHFEIPTSDLSIPPASWLPGDTDLYQYKAARLYLPGNNPSTTSNNAFGWFWNDLENYGIGALAFSLDGQSTSFHMDIDPFPIRCPGDNRVETTATVSFPDGIDKNIEVQVSIDDNEAMIWSDLMVLNASNPTTTIYVSHMTAGNEYTVTLDFIAAGGITWEEEIPVRAVSDHLFAPDLIQRDDYGLVGGLFQWSGTSYPEKYQLQISSEDDADFQNLEFDVLTEGESYRTKLSDWKEDGSVNNFLARDQGTYNFRIRAVNPSCSTTPSDWSPTMTFDSDSCEVWNVELPDETYNFEKGQFVTSSVKTTSQGQVTDVRLEIQGFHQKWSDATIAIKTPIQYLGTAITVPQFADGCDEDFDSGNFDIRFSIDESKLVEDICPPPQEGEPYDDSLIDPIGGGIFEDYVRGQNKRGTWTVEWLDRGIGFPTNGKIKSYDLVICSIPVPPREHIIYKGESKIKEGTIGIYGS